MRYKEFGKTGMKVSEMCLGTWGFGNVGWDEYDDATRIDAFVAAVENGINFVDTAPVYGKGASEKLVGKCLKEVDRSKVFVSTKCGNVCIDPMTYVRHGHHDEIIAGVEDSLKNLQTDYIDLYLLHWPDPNVEVEETLGAMQELKDSGVVKHIGVSNFTKEQLERVLKVADVEALQPQYSMVSTESEELMKWASANGVANMTYGSIGGGILTGKFREPRTDFKPEDSRNRFYKHFHEPMFWDVMKVVEEMDKIAASRGIPVVQVAINWAAQKDFVHTCIIGAQTRDKVLQNCAAFDWELTAEEIAVLDKAIADNLKK